MEQATLTYMSKSTIGVGLEAGTTQTPGLDVTIGFKESNVALVPVAVAKFCYKARGTACQHAIYQLALIEGGRDEAIENSPIEAQLQEINSRLSQLYQEQSLESDQLAELRARIAVAESAEQARIQLAERGPARDGETAEQRITRAGLLATSQSAPDNFDLAAASTETARLQAVQTARTATIQSRLEDRARLASQLGSNSDSERNDAFSVFGRFNGSAGGNAQGATLTAGKVFATGIAAQNLTEFGTTSDCLGSIRLLADMLNEATHAPQRAELLSSAGTICGRAE